MDHNQLNCSHSLVSYSNIYTYIKVFVFYLVPTPIVRMNASNVQTVGQSLTLQCEVTTVRGITSRVDILWSSDGTELGRTNNVSSTKMDNSLVYTDSYTISQLSTTDDGRVIQCEVYVVINTSPSVIANDYIILDVIGEYTICIIMMPLLLLYTQFLLLQSPYRHLIAYKEP